MNVRRCMHLVVVMSVALSACAVPATPVPTPDSTPAPPATTGQPRFEAADCWFEVPDGQTAECGYVSVPEDRDMATGKTLKLAVARFKSARSTPEPDPIVYLEGGPGGSALRSGIEQFNQVYAPLLENRDLILFDQRGTGYSQPALDCPEYKDWVFSVLDQDLSVEESERRGNAVLLECRSRLVSQGVNLAAFDSAENAADLDAVRQALGIEQWNLYGISYGTRLALTLMRDFPQGIRSVVIDSVVPLQVDLYTSIPGNAARAMETFFGACASNAGCDRDFPHLEQTFFDLVDRLNEQPATFPITLESGEKRDLLLNGDGMLGAMFQYLYITTILPFLPRLIANASDGNYALMGYLQGQLLSQYDDTSYGMHFSVQCDEEVPFESAAQLDAAIEQYPEYASLAGKSIFDLCEAWQAGTSEPVEDQPVSSSLPTLVLAGQMDPITPPEWAQLSAQTLSQSFYFEFPNAGHGASLTGGQCPIDIVLAFFDNPAAEPDITCIDRDMNELTTEPPANAFDITLVAFREGDMGFSGVVPEGWQQVGPGSYTPSGSLTDRTAIVMQAAPVAPSMILELMTSQFKQLGSDASFEEAGTQRANGLAWTLYSAEATILGVDLALAESGGTTYMILMQSLIDERETLADSVFLPAVEALQPNP